MGWLRRGQKTFYYRSRRVNGRVVSEYVGTGPAAELAAEVDVLNREWRRQRAVVERARRDYCRQLDRTLIQFLQRSESLIRAVLVRSGFYQHNRGPWRRRDAARLAEAGIKGGRSAAARCGRA